MTLVHRYPYTAWRKAWAGGIAGLDYLGCAPFDFGAFPGYRHQATTATAGLRGDTHAAALEVNTRCMTYAWRKAKDAPAAAAAPAAPAAKKGKAARSPRVAAPAAAEEDPLLAEANAALRQIQAEPAAQPAAKKRKGAVAGAAPAASEAAPKKKKKKKAQPGPE